MRSYHSGIQSFLGIVVLIGFGTLAAAESDDEMTSAADLGKATYDRHCAGCHGQDGRGTGDFANLLKKAPMDLSSIAERRGGEFPSAEIAEIIDGRNTPRAHGTQEMPIWGERLGELVPSGPASDAGVRGQIYLIVEYLRSIQRGVEAKPEATAAESEKVASVGEEQFLRNCASCHGMTGKGDGYVGKLLKTPPADLSAIAKRNGGTFPSLKVAEMIDGRQPIGAHGSREMPVWGERFAETLPAGTGHDSAVRGEVMLYVRYLHSIQEP